MENEWVIGRRAVREALKAGRSMGKLLVAKGPARERVGWVL